MEGRKREPVTLIKQTKDKEGTWEGGVPAHETRMLEESDDNAKLLVKPSASFSGSLSSPPAPPLWLLEERPWLQPVM